MKKLLILMWLVTLSSLAVQAIDSANEESAMGSRSLGYFSMPEIQVNPGETFVLPVSFICEDAVYSLGFGVSIPDGFEVVGVEKDSRVIGTFQYGTPAGACNVAIYNLTGAAAMEGNDGAVVNITLKANESASGDYTFTLTQGNYGVVGNVGDPQYPNDISTTVHVTTTPTIGALGYFSMPEIQAKAGDTFVLPVSFICEDPVYSLAFGVSIPNGFEVVGVEQGSRVTGTFQYATPAGECNVAIYNLTGAAAIEGNDGAVVNITLKATENVPTGNYTVTLSEGNYGVVGFVGNPQYPENATTTIQITPSSIGALGYFSMPEIQAKAGDTFVLPVSFTCEDPVYSLAFGVSIPDGFEVVGVEQGSRVTGTFQYGTPAGECNVAIYNMSGGSAIEGNDGVVVNITLKASENVTTGNYTVTVSQGNYGVVGFVGNPQYPENATTTIQITPSSIGALGYFSMPEIQAKAGDTFVLPVSFTCEDPVYSLAFGVSIPDGFEVVGVEQGSRVTGTFQYGTPAGECNVAIYNMSGGSAIDGNDGVVVNITLKATENVTTGNYTVTLSEGNYGVVGFVGNPQYPLNTSTTIQITPSSIGALGHFSMPEIQANVGDTFVLPVTFTCEDPVYSLAFGVSIPNGFEVVGVEQGSRVTGTFQYGTPAGECNVAIYNLTGGAAIEGTDGVVVNITLRATEAIAGDYTVTVSQGNYGVVGFVGNPQYPENAHTTIHLTTPPTIGELGYFTMPELQVEPGQTFVLPVSFTCEDPVYSLAFGVSIPDGFEVVSVEQADRVTGTFQYGTPAGECNVAIYNLSGGSAIEGNDGAVVNITLKASEDASGDYTFVLSQGNYGVVGFVGNPQYPYDTNTIVHVATAIYCDVNGDNKVNIHDVTDLINYLLTLDASGIDLEAADVNKDGKISISDVTDMIYYLLSLN